VARHEKEQKRSPERKKKEGYTIQIAAYKSLADAVQQMKALKSKGFTTYRTMGKTGNTIWHRVRAGSFESRKAAEKALQKLNNARVKGMIIKKE